MKDTNKNFLYNLLYQVFIFIIPLITIPYVSRVLGADNIGIYSYTYSLINYFMLASMLGINNYGSREIAKVCNNIEMRSKKFYSIYFLQLIIITVKVKLFNLGITFNNFLNQWISNYITIFQMNN